MFLFHLTHQNFSTSQFVPLDLLNSIYCSVCTDLAACRNHNSNQKPKMLPATLYLIQIMSPKNAVRACIHAQKQQSHLSWKQVLEKSGRLYRNLASLYSLSFHCVIFITYTVTITELNRRNDIIHKLRMITIIASELCV